MKRIIKFIIKYITLIFFSGIILLLTKEYTDHAPTVYNIILVPFLCILILINLIILYGVDHFNHRKNKGDFKITNRIVSGLFFIFIIHFSLNYYMENKKILLEAGYDKNTLTLYKNKTFKISLFWNHGSDNFLGNYEIKGNNLVLIKDDLESKTGYQFSNNYLIFFKNKKIISKKKEFGNLIIK